MPDAEDTVEYNNRTHSPEIDLSTTSINVQTPEHVAEMILNTAEWPKKYLVKLHIATTNSHITKSKHIAEWTLYKFETKPDHNVSPLCTTTSRNFLDSSYCTIVDLYQWKNISESLKDPSIVAFEFTHSDECRDYTEWDSDTWTESNFKCIESVFEAVESNTQITYLKFQPHEHPSFVNINFELFGKNKITKLLTVIPQTFRFGEYSATFQIKIYPDP